MKKFHALILSLAMMAAGFAQQNTANDIVVLLDTSSSMLPYFDTITEEILPELAVNFVRQGDTFHLISFNVSQTLEAVQIIKTQDDVEKLVARFFLLYPLGKNSDFVSALKYTTQYTSALRVNSNKTIVLISDGLHSPGATSDPANFSFEKTKSEIDTITAKMKSSGWDVYFIKTPSPEGINIVDLDGNAITRTPATTYDTSVNNVNPGKNQEAQVANTKDTETGTGPEIKEEQPEDRNDGSVDLSQADSKSADSVNNETGIKGTETEKREPNITDETGENASTQPVFNPETDSVDITDRITENLGIDPVKLPEEGETADFTKELMVIPEVVFPTDLGNKNYKFKIPLKITNPSEKHIDLELSGIIFQGKNILKKNVFLRLEGKETGNLNPEVTLPSSLSQGEQSITVQLQFADNIRSVPEEGTFHINLKSGTFSSFLEGAGPVILTILLILIAAVIIIVLALFIHRKTESSNVQNIINRTSDEEDRLGTLENYKQEEKRYLGSTVEKDSRASILDSYGTQTKDKNPLETYNQDNSRNERLSALGAGTVAAGKAVKEEEKPLVKRNFNMKPASSVEPIPVLKNRSAMLQLDVLNQTKAIGKRNIHIVKAGNRLSIGGGKDSPFEIFLVKFPKRIAEVRFNGENCDLAILKPEFFPYEETNIVKDCIGREFHIVSSKNYPVTFKLIEYEDPVKKLNALLTSIKN